MKLDDPAQKLKALHESAERISSNLVDLEIDSSRQLLDASALAGESAARWSAASDALTELWRRHGLLQSLLQRADKVQGSRRADELRSLLAGQSIELGSADVPLLERRLLGSARTEQRCSPDELLAGMSTAFDEVRTTVAQIGGAWESLIPKLDAARRELQDTNRLAEELGEQAPESAARTLAALTASVTTDPLSVKASEVDAVLGSLQSTREELERTAALKRGFQGRILEAREQLESLRRAVAEALAAREELLVKISLPTAPAAPERHDELGSALSRITELAARGAWRDASKALEAWSARADACIADAQRSRDASRAPIDARNQLRGLLEAYQVKAGRLGRIEDRRVAAIFASAQAALYDAPTDLAVAAQLVRSYQEALAGKPSTSGATP